MNLLPLETFRSQFSYHPWHWNQLSSAAHFPVSVDCADLVYEYGWQANDSAGREDVIQAIESAEKRLQEHLRYSPAPHYVTETVLMPRFFDGRLDRLQYSGADGRWLDIQLGEGKIRAVGVETRTLIGTVTVAGGTLVFSDADGDGLNDTFTATIATAVTDVSEIEAMFVSGDRWTGEAAGDKWSIRPVNVSISGGTATIKGRIWQIVRPVLYESGNAIDPATTANYAASLEIYRHYCDTSGQTNDTAQALLVWETRPYPFYYNSGSPTIQNSADPAAFGYALARVALRDAERGIVGLGEAAYDTTSSQWVAFGKIKYPPDRIIIRYLAGDALDSAGHMQERWAKIVSRFAAAELGKRVCACNGANRAIYEQQIDHSFQGDARVEKFQMSAEDNLSPFGYKEGALYAWRAVRSLRQLVGVLG